MKRQAIYNKVRDHLLKQGRAAKFSCAGYLVCAYRGDDGTACAVGCLIPAARYSPEMEGLSLQYLISGGRLPRVSERTLALLQSLQSVHDTTQPYTWATELAHVARLHGLKP